MRSAPRGLAAAAALCTAWACAAPAAGADVRADAAELVRRGVDLFDRASALKGDRPAEAAAGHAAAAECFERAAAAGAEGGKLEYNLGNAYLLSGDVGRAVLSYRRAERRLGDCARLQANLALARRMRADRIEPPSASPGVRTLLFWHYDVGRGVRAGLFAVCYVLAWCLAGLRRARRAGTRWTIRICAAAAVLLGGSLLADSTWLDRSAAGVILAPEVAARTAPGADAETQDAPEPGGGGGAVSPAVPAGPALHAGTEFTLVEARGRWLHIELPDGRQCWIPSRSAALVRRGE